MEREKDTVYLCYNEASNWFSSYETNFGEIWSDSPLDFYMNLHDLGISDSSVSVDVQDTSNLGLYYEINVYNAVFPLTFYWDVNLSRSDSLPCPEIPIFP